MYKTILIPVDPGDAQKAQPMIEVARKMAEKKAKIVFVSVVEEVPAYASVYLPESARGKVREEAKNLLSDLAKGMDLETEIDVRSGSAHVGILGAAEEKKADLILVGSHRPGVQDYFLGSTAARVVRHAKCSVFILR